MGNCSLASSPAPGTKAREVTMGREREIKGKRKRKSRMSVQREKKKREERDLRKVYNMSCNVLEKC